MVTLGSPNSHVPFEDGEKHDHPTKSQNPTNHILVGILPHLKHMKVSWDDEIPNIWKHKKCSKPPTSLYIYTLYDIQFSIVKQNPTFVSTLAAGCFMTIVSHLPSLLASSDKKSMAGCQQPSSCIKGAIFLRGSLPVPTFCSWKLRNCSQSL